MFNFKSAEDVMSLSEFRINLSSCVEKARKTGIGRPHGIAPAGTSITLVKDGFRLVL